jgi:class 3 adenylate cyclase
LLCRRGLLRQSAQVIAIRRGVSGDTYAPLNTRILIIEDDPVIRQSLALCLKNEGYIVREAADGRTGLELARAEPPDLIICDVVMPEMDGFAVVSTLRSSPQLRSIPFVFLTSRDERADVRRGMNLGADDYLTKPFTRDEVVETVKVRLKKHDDSREALTQQLILGSERLHSRFLSRLTGAAEQPPIDNAAQPGGVNAVVEATVLFTDIRGFTTISERLSVAEIAALLREYLRRACEPIVGVGGRVVKFIGDGIMAVFPHGKDQPRERQALHAIQAGLALSMVAHQFRGWMNERYGDRGLPEFSIGVGIHTGEVTLCQLGGPGQEDFTAIGDTVNIASRLEGQTKELGWPVVASGAAISAAGDAVRYRAHRVVHLRGRTKPVLVYEVVGLKKAGASPDVTGDSLSLHLQGALAGNAEGAAMAAKAALRETLLGLLAEEDEPSLSSPQRIKNYTLVRKLGGGDEAALYLAERESDGQQLAVAIRRTAGESALRALVQQATLLRRMEHPHLARIYDHGFADDVAYFVMEHFPRGSLRDLLAAPLEAGRRRELLGQARSALGALERAGIAADAIGPERFMLRDTGELALNVLASASPQRGRSAAELLAAAAS